MDLIELRLECVKIAADMSGVESSQVLGLAREIYEWLVATKPGILGSGSG